MPQSYRRQSSVEILTGLIADASSQSSCNDVFESGQEQGRKVRSFLRSQSQEARHYVLRSTSTSDVTSLDTASKSQHFPIAIVGIGCRMPGDVNSPEAFWDVLVQGKDVLSEVPPERWSLEAYHNPDPASLGTHVNKRGGFIRDMDRFDNGFFKISPKEAAMMDPQQRHLLEVTHEAFEDAGIETDRLGEKCGVYVGIGMMDYPLMLGPDSTNFNAYAHTGVAHSVAANRISFAFNLQGPSVAVDTACAASMTALHFGCQALWNNECGVSVVAGSNVLLMPEVTAGFSALSVLSPEGQSRPFDVNAKGYVRSEGFGAIIVKPLAQAMKDGDNIYCTIMGSGIASNGATPSITMPSCNAQERLMTSVYEQFKIEPERLIYVEAHGTGTPVGDPMEAEAIGKALAAGREKPLRIGSAKSNFGHMECCAGMVSIIKTALMLKHRKICPSINFTAPIDERFKEWNIDVQTQVEDFPAGRNHLIGVNNYGFGGALAHAVLGEVPFETAKGRGEGQQPREQPRPSRVVPPAAGWRLGAEEAAGKELLLPLSAKTEEALLALAERWSQYSSEKDAEGVLGWAAARRSHFPYRLVVQANSGASLRQKLQDFLASPSDSGLVRGTVRNAHDQPKICFLFPGQGQQGPDMGRQLFAKESAYREVILQCDRHYSRLAGESILQATGLFLTPAEGATFTRTVDDIDVSQPAILFHQVALVSLWRHWGIEPSAVIGHSFGELAAAFAAGFISIKEAVEIVYHRCQLQKSLQGTGAMAALRMTREDGEKLCSQFDDVHVACVNAPGSVTIAGSPDSIRAIVTQHPTLAKQLRVQCAFHTAHMDGIQEDFVQAIQGKQLVREAKVPFYSTVSGGKMETSPDGRYWWDNVRQPVNFLDGVTALLQQEKPDIILEVSAAATLLSCVQQIAKAADSECPALVNSCLRNKDDRSSALKALSALYVSNAPVQWKGVFACGAEWDDLPKYPWQHRAFWCEAEYTRNKRLGLKDRSFKGHGGVISTTSFPFLKDHVIQDKVVFPGAGYLEYVAEDCLSPADKLKLKNIRFKQILALGDAKDGSHGKQEGIQLTCARKGDAVSVTGPHAEHASCVIQRVTSQSQPARINRADVTPDVAATTSDDVYTAFTSSGLQYGPAFQVIDSAWLEKGRSLCKLRPAKDKSQRLQVTSLDGCFQAALLAYGLDNGVYLPVALDSLELFADSTPVETSLFVASKITDVTPSFLTADIDVINEAGDVIMAIRGFKAQNVDVTNMMDVASCLYRKDWQSTSAKLPDVKDMAPRLTWDYLKERYPEDAAAVLDIVSHSKLLSRVSSTFAQRALDAVSQEEIVPNLRKYHGLLQDVAAKESELVEDMDAAFEELHKIPDFECELRMFHKLGSMLGESLKNPKLALEVLFAADGLATYFLDSLTTRLFYKMVRDMVRDAVTESLRRKAVVRVLEVGGRMGGLSRFLCEALREELGAGSVEYLFTDLTRTFFLHAQQTLAEFPQVRYLELDIEKDVTEQGFLKNSVDVVVCLDSLHAVVDVTNGLANMRELLAPQGWLMMLEATETYNVREIMFGTLELCWVFQDFRQKMCWLPQQGWKDLMANHGFADVVAGPEPDFFHSVLIGRKTDDVIPTEPEGDSAAIIFSKSKDDNSERIVSSLLPTAAFVAVTRDLRDLKQHLQSNKRATLHYVTSDESADLHELLDFLRIAHAHKDNLQRVWVVSGSDESKVSYPNAEMTSAFARVAVNEFRDLPVFVASLDLSGVKTEENLLVLERLTKKSELTEREFLIREGEACLPRVTSLAMPAPALDPQAPWQLAAPGGASLDALRFFQLPLAPLKDTEVRVKVTSSALNFKDVMCTMGLLGDIAKDDELGLECSGKVVEVGAKVTGVKAGDEVIALGDKCLASHVTAPEHFVCRKPGNVGFEQAAGVGIVFATAYEALVEKANLQADETVLIHSAAGGVGQAAIQIAQMLGAAVICTAGSPEKRRLLQEQYGIQHITDSRSTRFKDDVMAWTEGRGVDVILNSLSGEKLLAGLEVLAEGGRFCEIGKRDILEDSPLGAKVFLENKSFLSVQLDLLMRARPKRVQRLLQKVCGLLESGAVKPVETRVYKMADHLSAFRLMLSGGHTGKLVLQLDSEFSPPALALPSAFLDPQASYLVTGATGGLGLALLRWLAEKGARHVICVSRRGFSSLEQTTTLKHVTESGVSVQQVQADVAKPEDVSRLMETVRNNNCPPLKGVFHLAGLIEDDAILNLEQAKLERVLAAKARAAFLLHEATAGLHLDHFVTLSSVMTLFGNIEQGAYVAANAYLESLARQRHAEGLPALTVQLGAVTGAGVLHRNQRTCEIVRARGLLPLHVDNVFTRLDVLMAQRDVPVLTLSNTDWDSLKPHVYEGNQMFASLLRGKANSKDGDSRISKEELEERVRRKLAALLDMSEAEIQLDKPMVEYGVDSLMAVEMVNWLNKELDITASQLDILGGVTTSLLLEKAYAGEVVLSA